MPRQLLVDRAIALRAHATAAEKILLENLTRKAKIPFCFQHVIGSYIVDFFFPISGLIVEVDGGYHRGRTAMDGLRTSFLTDMGFTVKRYWNEEVENEIDRVSTEIRTLAWRLILEQRKRLRREKAKQIRYRQHVAKAMGENVRLERFRASRAKRLARKAEAGATSPSC